MSRDVGFTWNYVLECTGAMFGLCEPPKYVPYNSPQPLVRKPHKNKRLRKSSSEVVYRRTVKVVQITEETRSRKWRR